MVSGSQRHLDMVGLNMFGALVLALPNIVFADRKLRLWSTVIWIVGHLVFTIYSSAYASGTLPYVSADVVAQFAVMMAPFALMYLSALGFSTVVFDRLLAWVEATLGSHV